MPNRLLTPEEVAGRLQISRLTVMAYLRGGALKGIKVGRLWRVDEADFQDFLKTRYRYDVPLAADVGPGEQAVAFATDESDSSWMEAEFGGPLPAWDWGPGGSPSGKPVRYVPGVGLVIEGGKPRGE